MMRLNTAQDSPLGQIQCCRDLILVVYDTPNMYKRRPVAPAEGLDIS